MASRAIGTDPIWFPFVRMRRVSPFVRTPERDRHCSRKSPLSRKVLTVTRGDRLARSTGDLQDIVREMKAKGAHLRATEQPIDTSTAAGKAFLDMLGVFAEFETNLRRERQLEGITRAKAEGVYMGSKPRIDREAVQTLHRGGK